MARVHFRTSAIRDLDEIWLYIAQDSVDAAEKVIDSIESAAKTLSRMPGIGQRRDDLMSGLRSFPVRNYVLFYKLLRGGIDVVHVYHGRRNIDNLFAQEK